MKSLKPRLLTAIVGIPLLLIVLFVGEVWNPIIGIAFGLVSAIMIGEYLNANKLLKVYELSLPCIAFSFALTMLISTQYIYILIVLLMIVAFLIMIFSHEKISYANLAYAVIGTILISFGMSALPAICKTGVGVTFFFIVAFTLPWMADAGGFFVGASMGKNKLCPSISPKKTVEGAVGGVLFCIVSAVLIWVIFQFLVMPGVKINIWALILLAVIDAPMSILGDLSFSLIKRSLKIKDYGSIFPGHGGMLDRFDSIIFTAPIIVAVNQFIPFITVV